LKWKQFCDDPNISVFQLPSYWYEISWWLIFIDEFVGTQDGFYPFNGIFSICKNYESNLWSHA
jgi:hypothetical protein